MYKPCKGTNSEKGVALIMVLGLLTVMVLMAVTFAISMRTERLAAGNAADTLRARELVHVALGRALGDLANKLGTNGINSHNQLGVQVGKAYPGWNVTNSYTNIPNTTLPFWNTAAQLVRGEATNYVPRAFWTVANNADSLNSSNHWMPIENLVYDSFGNLAESNLMGRVAYLIINCSGLLDANYAGSFPAVARGPGTNFSEIAIANLEEIGANLDDFITARNTDVRFETLAQLNANGDLLSSASNLFVYSRGLPGYWDTNFNCVGTQVNLSGSAADLVARQSYITNALTNIGFSQFEAGFLYSNLVDYVDGDYIPTNREYSVEPVPMINEVVVSNNVTVAASVAGSKKYTIHPYVYVECWYPFVSNPAGNYSINCAVTFNAPNIFPNDPLVAAPVVLGAFSPGDFPLKMCFDKPYPTFDVPQVNPVRLVSSITLSVTRDGVPVDQITVNITLTNENDGATVSATPYVSYSSAECRDPRINFNPNDAVQWRKWTGGTPTLGAINTWAPEGLFPADSDGDEHMFIANQPLRSIAELGSLAYTNSPWKTVKLYGPNCHRVLDVFGLSTNTSDLYVTNIVYRGRVNCSSNSALNACAAMFANMPVDQYPGEGVNFIPMMPDAQAFVTRLFSKGTFTNLSDIGRNLVAADFQFPPGLNELQREAYFRNAINLINLRQNMFTIIIEAQAASGGNIPRNPARQRAVAIVWRDPYTGEMFVRNIKWLGD